MVHIILTIGLGVFGAAFGSFAAASVWRLRAKQLQADKRHGEKVSNTQAHEVSKLAHKRPITSDRSVCLHCGRQLTWYDMVPVVSWVALRGKCRTCQKPIGKMELLAEIGLAVAFIASYLAWPYELITATDISLFVLWCVMLVLLAIHWMYDARWYLLLDIVTLGLLALAIVFRVLLVAQVPTALIATALWPVGLSLLVLPGFYGLLYVISRGRWIGLGDVKLLVPLALLLPSWEYGILLIFLANLIGCIAIIPGMLAGKLSRDTHIPFGPFLIFAFVLTFLWGHIFIDFYIGRVLF